MNRKQRVVIVFGIAAVVCVLLFPPWRFGRVSLPYRPRWPPFSSPIRGLTGYPPSSFVVDAPELDPKSLQAVTAEIRNRLQRTPAEPGTPRLIAALYQLRVDTGRLLLMLGAIVGLTVGLVVLFRGAPPAREVTRVA